MIKKYTIINFYNNNLVLIVYRWWSTKYIQWLLWLQYNILKKYKVTTIFTDELTQPVACRAIATRWLISEATCCEECPYFTRSKTKVQNVNRPEVRLHKMDAKLLSSQAINWLLEKLWRLSKVLSEECQGRPTPWSFSTNVKVNPTPISLLRRK